MKVVCSQWSTSLKALRNPEQWVTKLLPGGLSDLEHEFQTIPPVSDERVRYLEPSQNKVTDWDYWKKVLSAYPSLEIVQLQRAFASQHYRGNIELADVHGALHALTRPRVLRLPLRADRSEPGNVGIAPTLQFQNLVVLDMSASPLLTPFLSFRGKVGFWGTSMPALTSLDMSNRWMGYSGVKHLRDGLRGSGCRQLQSLSLRGCQGVCPRLLLEMLNEFFNLTTLLLDGPQPLQRFTEKSDLCYPGDRETPSQWKVDRILEALSTRESLYALRKESADHRDLVVITPVDHFYFNRRVGVRACASLPLRGENRFPSNGDAELLFERLKARLRKPKPYQEHDILANMIAVYVEFKGRRVCQCYSLDPKTGQYHGKLKGYRILNHAIGWTTYEQLSPPT
jgi:hypothetical protein